MAILASTRIRQNWRIFGEYSNSTNSPASGHCLLKIRFFRSKIKAEMKFVLTAAHVIFTGVTIANKFSSLDHKKDL
jgi:hypothetical protein